MSVYVLEGFSRFVCTTSAFRITLILKIKLRLIFAFGPLVSICVADVHIVQHFLEVVLIRSNIYYFLFMSWFYNGFFFIRGLPFSTYAPRGGGGGVQVSYTFSLRITCKKGGIAFKTAYVLNGRPLRSYLGPI